MGSFSQDAYIKASNTSAEDAFGAGIVVSADGTTLAVGAWRESSSARGVDGDQGNDSAPGAGAVYVFRRVEQSWMQEAYIKASNAERDDGFGHTIALSADGSTLAVGAYLESSSTRNDPEDNAAQASGAVYVFRRTERGAWTEEAYLKAHAPQRSAAFGLGVALSADGLTVAVGAPYEDDRAGAVYVFRRNGEEGWHDEARLTASTPHANDRFGWGTSLSADGAVLAIGAFGEAEGGAVYVLRRGAANRWSEEFRLEPGATQGNAFGRDVGLSGDGCVLGVGGNWTRGLPAGWVFRREGQRWLLESHFERPVVAVSLDGATLALREEEAISILHRQALWVETGQLRASNEEPLDHFGFRASLSADGTTIGVAAIQEDSDARGVDGDQNNDRAMWSGAVYVFR